MTKYIENMGLMKMNEVKCIKHRWLASIAEHKYIKIRVKWKYREVKRLGISKGKSRKVSKKQCG